MGIHEERVRQVPRTELQVQEVTSPRAINRITQQAVASNQTASAPLPQAGIELTGGTTYRDIGNVGVLGGGSVIGGGIIGGGSVIGAAPISSTVVGSNVIGGGLVSGSTVIGGGSHVIGAGSVGLPVSNSVVVGQRF